MRLRYEPLAVLLVLVASPFWLPPLSSSLGAAFRIQLLSWLEPAFQGFNAARVGLKHLVWGTLQGPFLLEENLLLRQELAAVKAHEITHEELAKENARLKALLEFKAEAPWPSIPTEVIGRSFGVLSRTLILDKGSRDGVKPGQAVVTPEGLVGRITEVGPSVSRAMLLTDPHFRVSALVVSASGDPDRTGTSDPLVPSAGPGHSAFDRSRTFGLVMGTAVGQLLLTYVPREEELTKGDFVLTAGGRSFCPKGVPIGTVHRSLREGSPLYRSARLKPKVNLSAVEEVLVVEWRPSEEE